MFKNLSPGAIGIQANIEEGLALAKSAGFEGLDLSIAEANTLASEHSVDYVKNLWAEAGLKMGGWGLPVNYRGSDTEYDESLSRFTDLAKLAADLGCHRTTTVVSPSSNDRTFQENWDFHIKRLRPVAEVLKDYGHSLGFEFIGPATSRKISEASVHLYDGRCVRTCCWDWDRQRRIVVRYVALVYLPVYTRRCQKTLQRGCGVRPHQRCPCGY